MDGNNVGKNNKSPKIKFVCSHVHDPFLEMQQADTSFKQVLSIKTTYLEFLFQVLVRSP